MANDTISKKIKIKTPKKGELIEAYRLGNECITPMYSSGKRQSNTDLICFMFKNEESGKLQFDIPIHIWRYPGETEWRQ